MSGAFRWRIALPYAILILLIVMALAWALLVPACGQPSCRFGVLLAAGIVGLAPAGLIGYWLARRMVRPLNQIAAAAAKVARGEPAALPLATRRDEIGQLIGAVNGAVEHLKADNRALAAEQKRLEAILATMGGGVIIADRDGRVRRINAAAIALLDVPEDRVAGATLAEVLRHHRLIEAWQACRQSGAPQSLAHEVSRPDRSVFWQVNITDLSEGGADGYLVLLQDLSEIHRLQGVRRDFISNISHELRTPLAAVKALLETIQDAALDDPPAARRFLGRAEAEVETMSQMVEELLELSRIESGMVPLRLAPVAVPDIILPVMERFQPQAERAGVALTVDIEPGLAPALVDAERIRRVLANLVHNAVKFTAAEGQVRVRAFASAGERPEGRARSQPDEPMVVIEVRDSGVGIPPGDLPRIFERFYKADRARSRGGTGLGLAIARHLVNAHGGELWVKSKQGKGSTFSFSLPTA